MVYMFWKQLSYFCCFLLIVFRLQEVDGIVMTPYERNLDFWRQLWRVVERR